MIKKISISLLFLVIIIFGYFIFIKKQSGNSQVPALIAPSVIFTSQPVNNNDQASDGLKTYIFNNFHGSTNISDKFQFQYPANWYNEGQYFSPQKIQFYDLYSVKAPIYFDLILAEIFEQTELKYQIDNSKRKSLDTTGQIDGEDFQRYDLIDYGSYGGDSAGHIKIFVGPKIKIDSNDYFLVFHWEEKPLAEYMAGNNVEVFDNMLLTFKFLR